MSIQLRHVRVACVSFVATLSVTFLFAWPSSVNAVGQELQAEKEQAELAKEQAAPPNTPLAKNEARVDALTVTATLETAAAQSPHKVIRLECHNPTNDSISGKVRVMLTRTAGTGMERVMPTPQIAWNNLVAVTVPPRDTVIQTIALPKAIGAEVLRIDAQREKAMNSENVSMPKVYYDAVAEAVVPGQSNATQRARLSKARNLAPLVYRGPFSKL